MNNDSVKHTKGFRLFQEIIDRSIADNWEEARLEWTLDHIKIADDEDVVLGTYSCLCGHKHLKELCFIKNEKNQNKTLVGNCCVKKFMPDLQSDAVFKALRKLNHANKISRSLISYAHDQGIINDWERGFLISVHARKRYTAKQYAKLDTIRTKIKEALCPK